MLCCVGRGFICSIMTIANNNNNVNGEMGVLKGSYIYDLGAWGQDAVYV